MGALLKIEQDAAKPQISQRERQRELKLWLVDQLTILAEAFSEEQTSARLQLYAGDLCDLPQAQLELAFNRARRTLKFYPKISELRELATGAAPKDQVKVEAEAAWHYVNDFLRKWGADRMPLYSGGKRIEAPVLPERVQYALRSVGGLWGLNQVTAESRPFVQKDFIEAYNQAPIAGTLTTQLEEQFGDRKLLGQVKQLAGVLQMGNKTPHAKPSTAPVSVLKKERAPMTDAQLRDRREILRQQTAHLAERSKNLPPEAAVNGCLDRSGESRKLVQ